MTTNEKKLEVIKTQSDFDRAMATLQDGLRKIMTPLRERIDHLRLEKAQLQLVRGGN